MSPGAQLSYDRSNLADCLREFHTEAGRSLLELVDESPVLLVFLRHFSCAFLRHGSGSRFAGAAAD